MKETVKPEKSKCVVFTGGGTGGHIYPGLAVAETVKKMHGADLKIFWIGNKGGMDKNIVEKSGIEKGFIDGFIGVPSGKLRRNFSFKNFIDFFKIFFGVIASFFTLLKLKPGVLFSKGGFVSVTPCFAAKLLRIPVITHECDFTPGLATRINSKFASKILVSYEDTKKYFSSAKQQKIITTGNPVRPIFYNADREAGRAFLGLDSDVENANGGEKKKPVLLVIGGSLGAHQINMLVKENLFWLTQNFIVVHQMGKADWAEFEAERVASGVRSIKDYHPYEFIYSEMPDVIAASDIVLSRAGANSLAECAVLRKPMLLIPLCGSGTRGDQIDNAEFFKSKGAAFVLNGEEATGENLKKSLSWLLDVNLRVKFAENLKEMTKGKKSSETIAEIISEMLWHSPSST